MWNYLGESRIDSELFSKLSQQQNVTFSSKIIYRLYKNSYICLHGNFFFVAFSQTWPTFANRENLSINLPKIPKIIKQNLL